MYLIYSHTTPDGKVYIGQSKDVEGRWRDGKGYQENDRFYKAIQQFGWENIKHDIICECETKAEADFYEAIYIVALDTENENRGYNKTNIKSNAFKTFANKVEYSCDLESDSLDKENFFEKYGLPRSYCSILIDEWIFNERDRAIMKRRYLDGLQYQDLSEEFGLSQQRIKTIVYSNANKIKKHL